MSSVPDSPEEVASPPPAPAVLPRWREDAPGPVVVQRKALDRQKAGFRILCVLLALAGSTVALLAWLSPIQEPVVAPIWVGGYRLLVWPVPRHAQQDRQVFNES